MTLIDSHCHLDLPIFDSDRSRVIEQAAAQGVIAMLVPAIASSGWERVSRICQEHPNCHPAYGLHPLFLDQHNSCDIDALDGWLDSHPAKAVGECGLDFFDKKLDPKRQEQLFRSQIQIALNHHLPIIIHARRSVEAVRLILKDYPGLRGVLHSFSGSLEQARQLADMGYRFGFGGPVTQPNARRLRRLVRELPDEVLLLESDSPDQPDAQWRGKRNEPARVSYIAQEIAELREMSLQDLSACTRKNTEALFGIST